MLYIGSDDRFAANVLPHDAAQQDEIKGHLVKAETAKRKGNNDAVVKSYAALAEVFFRRRNYRTADLPVLA
jgi:hypothetical protein